MESHPCKKTRGVGASTPTPASRLEPLASPGEDGINSPDKGGGIKTTFCVHINAQGRRCRMLCPSDSSLCSYHARRHSQSTPADEALAAELLASIDDFTTAASVNRLLENIVKQLARKRIQRRDAIALAYLSQLLLNSLSAMDREEALREEEQESRNNQRPVKIIWDMPCPPYERENPPESTPGS